MSRDHSAAKKFRDVVASIARSEIEKMFPADRYAKVHEIHEDQRRVIVQYNGEGPDNLVSVPYNAVKPAYVGQWVRIGGGAGDRHIIDTLGGAAVEARTEEVLDESPLWPKWFQPDPRLIDTAPIAAQPESTNTLTLANGTVSGTVIRVPTRMSVNALRVYVADGRSGNIRALLYRMSPTFDAELLAEGPLLAASTETERHFDFDTQVPLDRGDEVMVAVHNLTGGTIALTGWVHRQPRRLDGDNALTYSMASQGSTPARILNAQWSARYADRSWYFSLVRAA